jgi:dephospho-CoA kinase
MEKRAHEAKAPPGTGPRSGDGGTDGRLVVGVTGGIASGKTAVTKMLEEMGAPVIDFDVVAREVVEPGKAAYQDIVAYFGDGILQADRTIDRKKLSGIVFQDREKRKKLEGFTHARIALEYIRQSNDIAARRPNAIIQVAVPLLIEANLQHLFHKILVVYVPRETQIARLTLRDGISREEAERILAAQMPIDDKLRHADFVIHNEGTLEETRRQVEALWKSLQQLQSCKQAAG